MMEAKIIVPHVDNAGRCLAAVIESTVIRACREFGGATVTDGHGAWICPAGRLYRDPVAVIVTATDGSDAARATIADMAADVIAATDQLAVYTALAGRATIVERPTVSEGEVAHACR